MAMVIINARVVPIDGDIIENGFVRVVDGKIAQVCAMPYTGDDTDRFDAEGGWLLPGFVDAHSHLGMWEDGLGFEGDDGNEDTDPATPQMRAVDAINPFDRCFAEAAAAGVTAVLTGPGSANPIGGQMCMMKTVGRSVDGMVLKTPAAMKMSLGENPKNTYHGKNQAPVTRMATAAIIRENLAVAERYLRGKNAALADDETDEPDFDSKCEALIPVVEGKLPVHFHAHRLDDILTALRISEEFALDCVIVHGTQAHMAADMMNEKNVRILCGPLLCDRSKPELRDLTPASPAILHAAGVSTAIITDHPVIPEQYINICAGLAVREGMPYDAALRAVTLSPAEICGVADRIGSITQGKDADLVLFAGDPLLLSSKPLAVWIDGERADRK